MNYLIAESGSTKTDWVLCNKNEKINTFQTEGINPNLLTESKIRTLLQENVKSQLLGEKYDIIYFYGPALNTESPKKILSDILMEELNCKNIFAYHDLLGAARAVSDNQSSIVCILGTGSNSCFFNGSDIEMQFGGHGYILGDEGSGTDLGKQLIKRILDEELTGDLIDKFTLYNNGKTIQQVKNELYQSDLPNVYLASFVKFFVDNISHPFIEGIVKASLSSFLQKTVANYQGFQDFPVHFVGSVAYLFKNYLISKCHRYHISIGKIVKQPIDLLVRYHQNNETT